MDPKHQLYLIHDALSNAHEMESTPAADGCLQMTEDQCLMLVRAMNASQDWLRLTVAALGGPLWQSSQSSVCAAEQCIGTLTLYDFWLEAHHLLK